MATLYADTYAANTTNSIVLGVDTTTQVFSALSDRLIQKGKSGKIFGTFVNTVAKPLSFATNPKLKLCDVAPGSKLTRFSIVPSADGDTDNDLTFNLGWTSAPTAFLSASTGLQAAAAIELDLSDLHDDAVSVNGDALEINVVAGELEAAATYRFEAEFVLV